MSPASAFACGTQTATFNATSRSHDLHLSLPSHLPCVSSSSAATERLPHCILQRSHPKTSPVPVIPTRRKRKQEQLHRQPPPLQPPPMPANKPGHAQQMQHEPRQVPAAQQYTNILPIIPSMFHAVVGPPLRFTRGWFEGGGSVADG